VRARKGVCVGACRWETRLDFGMIGWIGSQLLLTGVHLHTLLFLLPCNLCRPLAHRAPHDQL